MQATIFCSLFLTFISSSASLPFGWAGFASAILIRMLLLVQSVSAFASFFTFAVCASAFWCDFIYVFILKIWTRFFFNFGLSAFMCNERAFQCIGCCCCACACGLSVNLWLASTVCDPTHESHLNEPITSYILLSCLLVGVSNATLYIYFKQTIVRSEEWTIKKNESKRNNSNRPEMYIHWHFMCRNDYNTTVISRFRT